MKLRNKRTGKIVELEKILFKNTQTEDLLKWKTYEPNVNSLAELNEEWEDYKPTEPLIDDKDIRNRLRKWIEATGISLDTHLTGVQSGAYGLIIECGDNRIAFRYYKKLLSRKKTGLATMRELIGEEE